MRIKDSNVVPFKSRDLLVVFRTLGCRRASVRPLVRCEVTKIWWGYILLTKP